MITVIDIQNHIARLLKTGFPDYPIYVEDNYKDIDRDAFAVSVRPLLTTTAMKYKNKVVNVDIRYLSAKRSNRENLIMGEILEDILGLTLVVSDRNLYIEDLSISEADTVLNLGFTLDYNVGKIDNTANDYMEELEMERGDDI